jgi:hypothetical protein
MPSRLAMRRLLSAREVAARAIKASDIGNAAAAKIVANKIVNAV